MLITSIKLTNFLSFGESEEISLKPLNLVIGPNGSGKSNLLDAIELIKAAPRDFLIPIREGGGVQDWLWKGKPKTPTATINAVVNQKSNFSPLRYLLSFSEVRQQFQIFDERVEAEHPSEGHDRPYLYYEFQNGHGVLNVKGEQRRLQHEEIDPTQSILAQRKDPDQYPELTYLGSEFEKIRLYREWSFGRCAIPRLPQKADLSNIRLEPDASNLGHVLNRFRQSPTIKQHLLESLRVLYDGIEDYDVQINSGTVQVTLHEEHFTVPATRLSDGTLRYLCLLVILCDPFPPPLICIEEPELGLHPDVLPTLANLMKDASERTQLIVTTHSDVLVDAMSDSPESILVAEKDDFGTTMKRLNAEELKPWLEKYRLGDLWTRGEIGGTRW